MYNDTTERNLSTDNEQDSTPDVAKPLFSKEEVESTVKGFLLAWMRGEIVIDFPYAAEYIKFYEEVQGKKITEAQAKKEENENKTAFTNLIEVCSGRRLASPAELEQATTSLFRYIMWWRQGKRIKGKFLEYSIEQKIDELEHRLEATNRLVIEFIKWYRGSTSGEGLPKM